MLTLFIVYRASTISAERLCTNAATYNHRGENTINIAGSANQSDYENDITIPVTFVGNYGSSLIPFFFHNGMLYYKSYSKSLIKYKFAN